MAIGTKTLSLEEFHESYADEKPSFEYWFGEAVAKPVGTWLHGVLQVIIREFLVRAGLKSSVEVGLRIDPHWEPVPDVIGTLSDIEGPYPTKAIEIVVEILSPRDSMSFVLSKCRHYARIGITQIVVLDPIEKEGWQWVNGSLQAVSDLKLSNGAAIQLDEVWQRLDAEA